jgi:hypothetical protein
MVLSHPNSPHAAKVQLEAMMRFDSIMNLPLDAHFSISMRDPSRSCGLDIE